MTNIEKLRDLLDDAYKPVTLDGESLVECDERFLPGLVWLLSELVKDLHNKEQT